MTLIEGQYEMYLLSALDIVLLSTFGLMANYILRKNIILTPNPCHIFHVYIYIHIYIYRSRRQGKKAYCETSNKALKDKILQDIFEITMLSILRNHSIYSYFDKHH